MQKEGIATWKVKGFEITQDVRVIPGESVESGEKFIRYYDTCEVTYRAKNTSGKDQKFGMRILFDTLIGENDGVPFTIPGVSKLITHQVFTEIPDFVMCYENADLNKPGVVVQLNLKHAMADRNLDPPDELRLTKWPGVNKEINNKDFKSLETWDVPLADPKLAKPQPDSAVVMYWNPKLLKNGDTRDLGYTYSLSSGNASSGGKLSIAVGGDRRVRGEVTVMAVVNNAKKGETVTLELPKGFTTDSKLEQPVPAPQNGRPTPVTWKIIPNQSGMVTIKVTTSGDATQSKRVLIRANDLFAGG
jgi:hypothetical protein